ncbi:CAP domain-containing protein [Pseudoruegeria sp. HB172150]|uniref:CAP domain-containing protein n=1 Tax=Pseudoruegeria sp. HB172150 TaxID=2721164 RepID=UPI001552C953|nr:CAP domain-containing protein [Pseudoruegeria sp. HB172150]
MTKLVRPIAALIVFITLALPVQAACSRPGGSEAAAQQVVAETNALRRQKGLPPLRISPALMKAAQDQACHMAATKNMTHTGQNGSSIADRVNGVGYRWTFVAENVAFGQRSAGQVMESWAKSSGHRRNMLSGAREIGVALAVNGGRPYWAMVLASPL